MIAGFSLVSSLVKVASRFESVRQLGEKTKGNRCIYCLNVNGSFASEEHILSEALGSYDMVLSKGCVCDACNNGNLSLLDNALASFEPIAWSRVWFVPHNKKGKLPQANFQNFSIRKIGPRLIKFTPKDRTGEIKTIEQMGDDLYRYNVQSRFRGKRIDWQLIGRALYKIALGMVALKQGHEFACNSKFDAARSFIVTGQGIRNNLLVKTTFQPHPSMQVTYLDEPEGTPFFIDLFGLAFLLSLENTPVIQSDDEIAKLNFELISLAD